VITTFIMLKLSFILLLGTIAPSLHSESGNPFVSGFIIMECIKYYEGYYKIDTNGDVYSIPRNGTKNVIRKLNRNTLKSGYQQYILQKKGNVKAHLVHRLVAISFIPNPHNKPYVNHKDGDKSNNKVSNLEWCTQSENEIHAYKIGLKCHKGENAPYKKVGFKTAAEIRLLYIEGNLSHQEIANKYKLNKNHVGRIIRKEVW
jgi:hypothetical protein